MGQPFLTILPSEVAEKSTVVLGGTITDDAGVGIPAASLTSLKLWLYHQRTGAIINSRDGQSVLNTNGGAVGANGVLTLTLGPLDTVLESQALPFSVIVGEFEWVYNAGATTGRAAMQFTVRDFVKVT